MKRLVVIKREGTHATIAAIEINSSTVGTIFHLQTRLAMDLTKLDTVDGLIRLTLPCA